jgi:predicted 2-oxoglutarate/Fe(II)-dependent dioxygenase YbiX
VKVLVPAFRSGYVDGDSLDASKPLVWTIDDVFNRDECAATIAKIEELGPEAAPITTAVGYVMRPDVRNNERVIFDSELLAKELFGRIAPTLPDPLADMKPVGANERFRCYRYKPGQQFKPHFDGAYRRDEREVSLLTAMVYLNDGFEGGETAFLDHGVTVIPRAGSVLLFQHRMLHEGCQVISGTKYVLRSDVMYRS